MNCIIPFTKDVEFATNISEILSISLEHDYTVNDEEILGNFTIFGEYKTHEVSINKEKFEFVLPFSVTLPNKIEKDSLEFNIEDFTYELLDNKVLKVNIEYGLKADDIKEENVVFEKVENSDDNIEELLAPIDEELNKEPETKKDNEKLVQEERNMTPEKETILNNINKEDNTFVTYHIHILKENETIEKVCTKYNTTLEVLGEYNDLSNLTLGDKIIIPNIDE